MGLLYKDIHKRLYTILSVAVAIIVLATLFSIVRKQDKQITADARYTIAHETKQICSSIESSIGYAINSIQVTASQIAKTTNGKMPENPSQIISEYLPKTPFTSIEYIRADGMNTTDAGEPFDASDREYYINGIAGKTGIWVNFEPKYSKEPLLNFYTPLTYEGNIIGVITGTLGGNTTISPLLIADFLGEDVSGVLVDENNRVISATSVFESGAVISGILGADDDVFAQLINAEDETAVSIKCKNGIAVGSVAIMPDTGWKIIEVVPAASLNAVKINSNSFIYNMLAVVIATFVLYFLFIIQMNMRLSSKDIKRANEEKEEQYNILKSMSEIYYSMHLINLSENTVVEYSARNEVKEIVNQNNDAASQMKAIMEATVEDEYLGRVLEFTDLATLSERMNGKKSVSLEFVAKNYGWFRCEFIAIESDENTQRVNKVVFTTQIIDEEKRREEELKLQSSTDGLTGLLNRRAYIEDIAKKGTHSLEKSFVYLAIDINGLKASNDTLGHEAGDELIKGAAECILSCFGKIGNVYRTGGDEMVIMFSAGKERLDEIKAEFDAAISEWKGKLVERLSVSCGYVCSDEYPNASITELASIADKRMYEAKAAYYKNKEHDRRTR